MNTDAHVNGLDRINSTKGYSIDNVKSCCGECNYMKKTYILDELLDHLYAVHTHCGSIQLATRDVPLQNKMIVCNDRKKTHAQINEESEQRKDINKIALIEKYNNEEYKQNRATMLAHNRIMKCP